MMPSLPRFLQVNPRTESEMGRTERLHSHCTATATVTDTHSIPQLYDRRTSTSWSRKLRWRWVHSATWKTGAVACRFEHGLHGATDLLRSFEFLVSSQSLLSPFTSFPFLVVMFLVLVVVCWLSAVRVLFSLIKTWNIRSYLTKNHVRYSS